MSRAVGIGRVVAPSAGGVIVAMSGVSWYVSVSVTVGSVADGKVSTTE